MKLGLCMLDPDIDCPNHNDKRECTINNSVCSFYQKQIPKDLETKRYVRQPRWYEKYYKN